MNKKALQLWAVSLTQSCLLVPRPLQSLLKAMPVPVPHQSWPVLPCPHLPQSPPFQESFPSFTTLPHSLRSSLSPIEPTKLPVAPFHAILVCHTSPLSYCALCSQSTPLCTAHPSSLPLCWCCGRCVASRLSMPTCSMQHQPHWHASRCLPTRSPLAFFDQFLASHLHITHLSFPKFVGMSPGACEVPKKAVPSLVALDASPGLVVVAMGMVIMWVGKYGRGAGGAQATSRGNF
jgi:hypothetical protein